MRPLARLHAVTDAAVRALPDLGVRAAAIASAGSAVALHARDRAATAADLAALADRFVTLTLPAEASTIVSGRPDIARAVGAQGVQLAAGDLAPRDIRAAFGELRLGRSVHSLSEARAAVDEGADYLLLGSVFATTSHPDRAPIGIEVVRSVSALGVPVIAIGGITPQHARVLRDAGAYGVAAIRALWHAEDPARAALAFLDGWVDQ
ncbi:MAG TPA: thiamine phosphate synthase [Gemmatimonadales bacterium]|nr:thiamine phosphate synthase [Gemmatimonadales bacterium]